MIERKLTPEQKKLVDEYADVRAKCLAWKPTVNPHAARYSELQRLILSWFEAEPGEQAEEPVILKGREFILPVSPRENRRSLTQVPKLLKRLGQKWIYQNFTPTLKSIEKVLTKDELKKFVHEERTGPRNLGEPVCQQAVEAAA